MRILVGCEASGKVRRQLRARGHDAWSNDIRPAEDGSRFHMQMDVFEAIKRGPWDGAVFHPDCTFLTVSAEWCYSESAGDKVKPGTLFGEARKRAREDALGFFKRLWECDIPRVVIENPVGVVRTRLGIDFRQIVQPYEYGHDARKATCLWVRGIDGELIPTKIIQGKWGCAGCKLKFSFSRGPTGCPCCAGMTPAKLVWGNQTPSGQNKLGPSERRWIERSETYTGIADALAEQFFGSRFAPEVVDILKESTR